jgi:hypothetical protein
MNYPIPTSTEEIIALRNRPVDEDLIVVAIAGVIKIARSQGQSLPQITAEVLREDAILDQVQRRWLSNLVTQAWHAIP